MDPSTVGLALSYALTLQTNLNRFVTMFSETETSLVSVERIMEYQNAPQEAPFSIPDQGKLGPSKTSKLMGHALLAIRVNSLMKSAKFWDCRTPLSRNPLLLYFGQPPSGRHMIGGMSPKSNSLVLRPASRVARARRDPVRGLPDALPRGTRPRAEGRRLRDRERRENWHRWKVSTFGMSTYSVHLKVHAGSSKERELSLVREAVSGLI